MKFAKYLIGIVFATSALGAQATSFLEIVNRSGAGTTTTANDVVGAGIAFDIGQLRLNLDPGTIASISFSFVGNESGWTNIFYGANGQLAYDNHVAAGQSYTDSYLTSSILGYAFRPFANSALFENAANDSSKSANWGIVMNADRQSGMLLFDDSGAGPDRDYDDTVINFRLMMQPVPEPGVVILMLAGIAVLIPLSLRRRIA